MDFIEIHSLAELENALQETEKSFLLIYKKGSGQSDCALRNLRRIKSGADVPLYTVDVNHVHDVHPRFGIRTAPTLALLVRGQVVNLFKGCQAPGYYESILSGKRVGVLPSGQPKNSRHVVVYTTPGCSWCNTLKSYLKEHQVSFREINVAADSAQLEAMVRKSGQQGVPQTEINGQMIVGFDKNRISQLLQIP
jgi:glutaredoxin-like YruB-family protein